MEELYLIISIFGILSGGVGIWVKFQNEMTKIKSRVYYLETNDNELKAMLSDVMAKLQHIEILLASNQIKKK